MRWLSLGCVMAATWGCVPSGSVPVSPEHPRAIDAVESLSSHLGVTRWLRPLVPREDGNPRVALLKYEHDAEVVQLAELKLGSGSGPGGHLEVLVQHHVGEPLVVSLHWYPSGERYVRHGIRKVHRQFAERPFAFGGTDWGESTEAWCSRTTLMTDCNPSTWLKDREVIVLELKE